MDTQSAPSNNKKFLTLIVLVAVLVFVVFVVSKKGKVSPKPVPPITQVTQELQKTDFGIKIPTDFPSDIPIEEGTEVEQSYSLNYEGQKQLTMVFPSTKTVKENYTLYADFLEKQNWNVSNKYESMKVSSLYGTKESNDINVTISYESEVASAKSQVSISILKK
jgi:hypothetical protein